jgi:uncharacterized membrane protein YkvA (DUF1232 family)
MMGVIYGFVFQNPGRFLLHAQVSDRQHCNPPADPSAFTSHPSKTKSNPTPNKAKEDASRTLMSNGMTLLELAREYWKGTYREISGWSITVIAAMLAYVASPIDALPELALGPLGMLDDALILGLALKLINGEIARFNTWKLAAKKEQDDRANGQIIDI